MCSNQFLVTYTAKIIINYPALSNFDMSNNIFRNFSWGNNIPKIFTLFISLSVFWGGGIYVCKFTIISILLFWVLVSQNQ